MILEVLLTVEALIEEVLLDVLLQMLMTFCAFHYMPFDVNSINGTV